jgi:hypothetical protein
MLLFLPTSLVCSNSDVQTLARKFELALSNEAENIRKLKLLGSIPLGVSIKYNENTV